MLIITILLIKLFNRYILDTRKIFTHEKKQVLFIHWKIKKISDDFPIWAFAESKFADLW